jgi:hypothetical protein
MSVNPGSPRIPHWLRSSNELPLARVRSRVSAYLYGNILVLAAVAASTPDSILHGAALITVAATTVTTFLAHIVAHGVGQQLGRTEEDARLHVKDELRDALPILSSGVIPVLILALGALTVLSPAWSVVVAAIIPISRIALTGIDVERVSRNRSSIATLWTGFALALVSAVIVVLKVLLTH